MDDEKLLERIASWKQVITERVTADGQVCTTPCFVFAVHVEPTDGTLVIDAHLYDGHGTTEKEKVTFAGLYGDPQFCPSVPVFFRKGLYVHLETNVASMTVMYLSIRE